MGQSPEDLPVKSWPGHKWLIILLIVFALVSLAYSLVLPLGEAADEFEHFALIRFIAEQRRPPLTLQEQLAIGVKGDASPLYHSLVALLSQHVQVADLPELLDPRHQLKRAIPDDRLPFKGLYHTQDEAFPFRGIVLAWHLARLVSIPLGIVTILAVYLTVSTIYPHRLFLALAGAAFVAFIPRFTINSAIVSDDNLVLPLIALATLCLVRMVRVDHRPRTLILLGAWLGLAAIAKYHALLLLPLMTLVTAVLAWQDNWGRQIWLRRWGLVVLVFLLIAGVWFSFLFIQFNQVADRGWFQGLLAPLGDPVITTSLDRLLESDPGSDLAYEPALNWSEWLTLLFRTFWFRFGRGHLIQSSIINLGLGLLTLLALLGLAFAGLQFWRRNREHLGNLRAWRLDIILLGLLLMLYLTLVLARYLVLPTRETAQGRHLYPALTAIALFLVLGLSRLPQSFGAWRNALATDEREQRFDQLLFLGISGLFFTFVVLAAPLFIVPVYYPFLPVTRLDPAEAPIQHQLDADLGGGLKLRGYSLSSPQVMAGQVLPVTLFWQAGTTFERDYLISLCLFDRANRQAVCRQGHPGDGRYPTRAWEPDTLIRDEIQLPTPACLPPGDYELRLSASPLRLAGSDSSL
jgi:4-amino-4-deoxy-L-arabinose transferase-like glycosyltransferase